MRLKKQDFSQPSKFGYSKENKWVFRKKLWFCRNRQKLKILLLVATEIVRLLKTLKNCFLLKKKIGFSKKNLGFFRKPLKTLINLMRNAIELVRSLKTFKNFVFFGKTEIGISKKFWLFLKSLKVAKLHYKATGKGRILKAFQKLVFYLKKWMGFSGKKYTIFQKIDKGSKFAVECDWNSKISQHVQKLTFRKQDGYWEKNFEVFINR